VFDGLHEKPQVGIDRQYIESGESD